jgi:hypothetical protein
MRMEGEGERGREREREGERGERDWGLTLREEGGHAMGIYIYVCVISVYLPIAVDGGEYTEIPTKRCQTQKIMEENTNEDHHERAIPDGAGD